MLLTLVAFTLLVPLLGALFTPRAMSGPYVAAIRADLERRLARGGADAERLRGVLRILDRLDRPPP